MINCEKMLDLAWLNLENDRWYFEILEHVERRGGGRRGEALCTHCGGLTPRDAGSGGKHPGPQLPDLHGRWLRSRLLSYRSVWE